jgi:endonuclease YncB( thermonuclease family)
VPKRQARLLICSILYILLAAGCGAPANSANSESKSAEARFSATVVKVSDGDTLTVLVGGKREIRVRLDGIDCPELRQAYGTKAKQYASARVYGKNVTVIAHGEDDYGRTIGTVFIEDSSLNEELVALGLAWAYVYHSTEYVSLEKDARRRRIGLWSDDNPTPPWEFRNGRNSRAARQTASQPQKSRPDRSIVYVSRNGGRYHTKGCRSLSGGGTAVSVSEAERRGLTPCRLCKP